MTRVVFAKPYRPGIEGIDSHWPLRFQPPNCAYPSPPTTKNGTGRSPMYTVFRKLSLRSGNEVFPKPEFMLHCPISELTWIGSIAPCCIIAQASTVGVLLASAGYNFHLSWIVLIVSFPAVLLSMGLPFVKWFNEVVSLIKHHLPGILTWDALRTCFGISRTHLDSSGISLGATRVAPQQPNLLRNR